MRLGEPRAVGTLGKVVVEAPLLLAGEPAVELLRHRELGALARHEILELVRERPSGSEEEGLERGRGEPEQLRDLVVRASLELPEHERLALRRRDPLECAHELFELDIVLDRHRGDVLDELDLGRSRGGLAPALADDVLCDRDQPARRVARRLAPLERPERVHERRLGDVLRVRVVAEDGVRVAVDLADVVAIEVVEGRGGARAGLSGCHVRASRSRILASCASPLQTLYIGTRKFLPRTASSSVKGDKHR